MDAMAVQPTRPRPVKKKKKAKKKKKKGGHYQVPTNLMKLITLLVLLVSDADILFTFTSFMSYLENEMYISLGMVGLFSLLYLGGCIIAARESGLFVYRFREKVRLNEIAGLDLEDMDNFFKGLPITLPQQKSLQQQEKEFHDKAKGDFEKPTRAEQAGHRTTQRPKANEADEEEEEDVEQGGGSIAPAAGAATATLGKTPKESRKIYNSDPERALYLLCVHKDITFAFFRERRQFSRRVVKPTHSIPLVRLMVYGWQPSVSHTDFAGILNANALYSFTVGFPQLGATILFILSYGGDGVILLSLAMGSFSLILSIMNMILDFPKQLFDIAQKEGEAHVFALQAEEKSEFWEKKMEVEVQQKQEYLLDQSSQLDGDGIQKPLSIIRDVMDLERECMRARVDYVAHQMFMALHEADRRNAIRSGSLVNPYSKDHMGAAEEEEEDADDDDDDLEPDFQSPPPPQPAALPPPPQQATAAPPQDPHPHDLPPPQQPAEGLARASSTGYLAKQPSNLQSAMRPSGAVRESSARKPGRAVVMAAPAPAPPRAPMGAESAPGTDGGAGVVDPTEEGSKEELNERQTTGADSSGIERVSSFAQGLFGGGPKKEPSRLTA